MVAEPLGSVDRCEHCDGTLYAVDVTHRAHTDRRELEYRCWLCNTVAYVRTVVRVGTERTAVEIEPPDGCQTPTARAQRPPALLVESWGGQLFRKGWRDADVAKGPDCSERCYVVRYVDPDGPYDTLRAMLRCDPKTHADAGVRRYVDERAVTVYRTDGLVYDRREKTVTVDGEPVHLSPQSMLLLDILTASAGEYLPTETILAQMMQRSNGRVGSTRPGTYVTMSVSRLRNSLDPRPNRTYRFVTGKTMHGYRVPESDA